MQTHQRFRGIRLIPLLNLDTEKFLVSELRSAVQMEGDCLYTAPLQTGQLFSLMGVAQNTELFNTNVLDKTDYLDHKAILESIYIRMPNGQFVKAEVMIPYECLEHSGRREMCVVRDTVIRLHANTRSTEGAVLSTIDAYVSAGIIIELTVAIHSTINLEMGHIQCEVSISKLRLKFPPYDSLKDPVIQESISKDINKELLSPNLLSSMMRVVGYDIDINRMNYFNPPALSKPADPELAAQKLVKQYVK